MHPQDSTHDHHAMGISQYIKEIGRGARGAKALERAQAAEIRRIQPSA